MTEFSQQFAPTRLTRWVFSAARCHWMLMQWSVALVCLGGLVGDVVAADTPEVVVGIRGHYRVGRTTAVHLRHQSDAQRRDRSGLQLETLDGDGVQVRFNSFPMSPASIEAGAELGYVVPGSEAAPLVIRDAETPTAAALVKTRFPTLGVPAREPAMIPPAMPWVVAIGDDLGVSEIGISTVLTDKNARIAVTKIDSATLLPHQSLGYDGVDLVMINAAGLPVLRAMVPQQQRALVQWMREGGRIFACLGESVESFSQQAGWLTKLLPVEEISLSRIDPAALETFTASQSPLDVFSGIKLPRRVGNPLIAGRTTRRVSAVLAAEYVIGFGKFTVVAADLDAPLFAAWPERLKLVTQLVGDLFSERSQRTTEGDRSTSFNDLAGQMRGVLDQFAIKPQFSFSLISVIVMLLIAAVGPLDYLLVNRVLGKPLLGWLTFPLIAIALSVFLITQAAPRLQGGTESDVAADSGLGLIRANQFQIVDVDLVDGVGRGFAWAYLYSHSPAEVDVTYSPAASLDAIEKHQPRKSHSLAYPMGYPGEGFGGVQLAGEDSVLPPYRVIPSAVDGSPSEGINTTIEGLTIAPRSSKSIAMQVSFDPKVDADLGVIRRPGSELLRGEFVNPLPVDVLDGVLIYRNWVYLLPTRVPAGARIASLGDLRQKNFRWRLSRQQSLQENVTETTPWSAADFSDASRVAEMLMFHDSAGGSLYTGLSHDALGKLDLTHLLVDDRCMLAGRTERPLVDLQIKNIAGDADATIQPEGRVLSMVRVILPVRSTRLN
ncbi:hypothetical protein NHH03_24520 [Stieleria sp. TO1_6]|uniref:hypothetical protein n=1 Tax=Stieleria tagensis TaxID=2956795 RepID=UPI00209AC7C0|nr:hypothetical protein [Stieleria tagensis]MCO8124925.1 hypothetical protein [Stieleria tagensis]